MIEECPILQAKMQEKITQMVNQNVQLIGVEYRILQQKINVVTRNGLATNGAHSSGVKQPTAEWIRKLTDKPPMFDLQKQKETFVQAQSECCDVPLSC